MREADERDRVEDEDEEEEDEIEEVPPFSEEWQPPEKIELTATGPHALLEGVRTLAMETDYKPEEWSLRMPYDNFVLTLARTQKGEGALFEQRVGAGRILLFAAGSLFTNRALGNDDNAQLVANIVSTCVAPGGVVLFDDLRQGLAASYDPARFYRDPRLYKTLFIALALWLAWVLGGTRLRAPAIERHDPSEAALVRHAGGLIARTVAPWQQAFGCSIISSKVWRAPRVVRMHCAAPWTRAWTIVAMAGAPRGDTAAGARSAEILVRRCTRDAQTAAGLPAESPRQPGATNQSMNTTVATFEQSVQRELARVIVGAEDVVRALCIALLARGHVLVQGPPGLGKTLLAKTLARVLGGEFKRVQGTADLMPSDIVGTHVFDSSKNEFVFRRGPLFADVLLVDEINRTGPKTQSALLEAMEERQVSSERDQYPLPEDFLVLATQNPRDFEGTYPLPESQLDRFMLRIDMNYPERAAEGEILRRYGTELEARDPIPRDIGTHRPRPAAPGACRGKRAARIGGAVGLRARSGAGHARTSARGARPVDARCAGAAARGARARRAARR